MNVTDSDDVLRLSTVIDRQRRELDRLRAAAAGEAVVSMARGALMERLGLSSAEAASQLAELSAATGVPLAEMAAAVLSPLGSASAARASGDAGDVADARARVSGDAGDVTDARACASGDSGDVADARRASAATTGPRWLLTEAAAELAADGAELVGTLASQALAPLGASTMVLWLLEADGALTLLGEAGLPLGEASRWWHIPPQLDCPAQRVARGAADIWWHAGPPAGDSAPVIGPAGGARAVLALRERNAELLGVMEVGWRWMSATRMLKKLLTWSGSEVWSVTVGLSWVGGPPTLMMIQLLASATIAVLALEKSLASEHVGVEAPRAFHIGGDDEVGENDPVVGCWELRHR